MAGVDRMTVEDVVRRVLREEHGDVIASLGGAASRLRCSSGAQGRTHALTPRRAEALIAIVEVLDTRDDSRLEVVQHLRKEWMVAGPMAIASTFGDHGALREPLHGASPKTEP
jgi:hypothetical protein